MPVLWNLDAIHRNQLVVTALVLMFCPWPFITMFYVVLLASWVSEWEEEKIATTLEDHIEFYLTAFGYTPKLVAEILAEQDKFLRVDIQGGLTDAQVKRGPKVVTDVLKEMEETEVERTLYEWWNDWYGGLTKERYEILLQAIDFAKDDWETMTPIRIPPNEMSLESLDFWYGYLNIRYRKNFKRQLTISRRQHLRLKAFSKIKRNIFSNWYLRAYVDQWLDARSLNKTKSFFEVIEEDLIGQEIKRADPFRRRTSTNLLLSKEDRARIYEPELSSDRE